MTRTILSLLCMGLAIVFAQDDDGCINNQFSGGCFDEFYMAKVTCAAVPVPVCTCADYPEEDVCSTIPSATYPADLKPAGLNGEKCKEICEATPGCVFYRWDKEGSIDSHCLLMNKDQCNGFLPCDREHCLSGQAHCDGGSTPVPNERKCLAGAEFEADSVHWKCFYLDDLELKINIYVAGTVPTGVICVTAHKCEKFDSMPLDVTTNPYYHDLVVQCNPDRSTVEAEVTWGPFAGSDNDVTSVIDTSLNQLKDPKCNADWEPLELDAKKLLEPGVMFICENSDIDHFITTEDTVTIKAPNTCALLCNFHPTLTIENVLTSDGTGVWNKYDTGSNTGDIVIEDDIKCWDFMQM